MPIPNADDHASRSRRWIVLPAVVLGMLTLLLITVYEVVVGTMQTPTDAVLRQLFQERAQKFVQLRDMIMSQPTLRGVGDGYLRGLQGKEEYRTRSYWLEGQSWTSNDFSTSRPAVSTEEVLRRVGLPAARYVEYGALLHTVGGMRIDWSGQGRPDHTVRIWMYARGIVASGVEKSIVFFPDGIPEHYRVVANTDDGMPNKSQWYSPLGDGWYIRHYCW